MTMILVIRKYSVPLALLLAVFFFAGVTCSTAALANQGQIERCCDKDEAPKVPEEKGECFDCSCPSCVVVLFVSGSLDNALTLTTKTSSMFFSEHLPSGFYRTIDYPPEVL
jgi:hypothetical protein